MEITINKPSLLNALKVASQVVSKKSITPILQNIKLTADAEKETLEITATDLEITLFIALPAKVTVSGETCVLGPTFRDIISSCRKDEIVLTKEDTFLNVKSGTFSGKLSTISSEDFPELSIMEESASFNIPAETFLAMIEKTIPFSAKDDARYTFNSVLLESNGSFNVVATDTKRLSVYKAQELEDKFNLLIPEKTAKVLLSALHPESDIQMVAYPKRVKIAQDNITIISNLIEGNFPDYNHIVPKDFKSIATYETKALKEAVSSLKPFMEADNPRVTLNILKNSTSLNSKENELGLGENAVESSLEGDEVKIAFNYFFLQSILDTITDENLIVNIVEPNKPALFQGSETKDHFIVTVPMKAEA